MTIARNEDTRRVYLDHAATSPLRAEVWSAMQEALGAAYNPASTHAFGREANRRLEEARGELGGLLGCRKRELYFTGGGTASNNLAILGFARGHRAERPRVLLSAVEHKACLKAARRAAAEGAEVRFLPVDGGGTLRLEALQTELEAGAGHPTLVSLMWANNEVGAVQPVAEAAELAHRHGALFHTDAVQAFGKVDVSLEGVPADLLTITAHKLGGPVGVGLLFRREGVELEAITYGGAQERGLWPGTQNPVGAVGFAVAARLAASERSSKVPEWREMRDRLASRILEEVPGSRQHAADAPARLPNLLSVGIPGCDPAALLLFLDMEGIAVSTGSACSSGSAETSSVLQAMGLVREEAYATLRFSLGPETTPQEIERAAEAAVRACHRVRDTLAA
ncbi:MAG: cysteine desulfurase family protein [Gemmatimonadota bacterium]